MNAAIVSTVGAVLGTGLISAFVLVIQITNKRQTEQREESDRRFAEQREESDRRFAEQREESDRRYAELIGKMNDLSGNIHSLEVKMLDNFSDVRERLARLETKLPNGDAAEAA